MRRISGTTLRRMCFSGIWRRNVYAPCRRYGQWEHGRGVFADQGRCGHGVHTDPLQDEACHAVLKNILICWGVRKRSLCAGKIEERRPISDSLFSWKKKGLFFRARTSLLYFYMFQYYVFLSSNGFRWRKQFQVPAAAFRRRKPGGHCEFLITNSAGCGALQREGTRYSRVSYFPRSRIRTRLRMKRALLAVLKEHPVDFVTPRGLYEADSRLVHPRAPGPHSECPPGAAAEVRREGLFWNSCARGGHRRARKEERPTIHLVNEHYDQGAHPRSARSPRVRIGFPGRTRARVLREEHALFWRTLRDYAQTICK